MVYLCLLGKEQQQTGEAREGGGGGRGRSFHPLHLTLPHPFFTPSIQGALRTGSKELGNHVWYLAVFTNIKIIGLLEFHDVTQHLKILVYNNILSSITITLLWAEYSNSPIIWHLMMINILDILSSSWLLCPCGRRHNFYCSVMVIPSIS